MKTISIGSGTVSTLTSRFVFAFALAFGVSACGAPEGASSSDEGLEKTEGAVAAFGIWNWGCDGSGPCNIDLDVVGTPPNTRTCFLAGVWGYLQNNEVQVLQLGGHWHLQVLQNGHPLGGTAVCIASGSSVPQTFQWTGGAAKNLGSGANRRCFLGGVRNGNGFTATSDFVHVFKSGATWFLGDEGTMAGKNVIATATCVDVPTTTPERQITVPNFFSNKKSFVQSNTPGGWACGLTKLGGHFTANDFNDGAWIDFDNTTNPNQPVWEQNGVNGKVLATTCVK